MTFTTPRAVAAEAEDVYQVEDVNAESVPPSHSVLPYAFDMRGAADYVAVSIRTLEYAVVQGDLRLTKVGKKRIIRRADLEAWIDANARTDSK